MSRALRIEYPGAFYHAMSRGNERRDIFFDDEDRNKFLSILGDACRQWRLKIHAYALMTNHYHLFIEAVEGRLSLPMRHLNGVYTQYFNRRHRRVGHLFQGRFKAILVEKDAYLLTLSRYIHQNPVAAKLARRCQDYPWSSCRFFLGTAEVPHWLETQDTLGEFGVSREDQQHGYRIFLETKDEPDPQAGAVNRLMLGTKEFIVKIKRRFSGKAAGNRDYAHRKALNPEIPPEKVLATLSDVFGTSPQDFLGGRWSKSPMRPIAMAFLRRHSLLTMSEIANLFNVGQAAVSWQINKSFEKLSIQPKLEEKILSATKALEALRFET